jgi:hypothetical protein
MFLKERKATYPRDDAQGVGTQPVQRRIKELSTSVCHPVKVK